MAHATAAVIATDDRRRRGDLDETIDALADQLAGTDDDTERAVLTERLVLAALPLADSVALRYHGRGIETEDLVQVARTALVKAVRRYRRERGRVRRVRLPDHLRRGQALVPRPGLGGTATTPDPGAARRAGRGGGAAAARAAPRTARPGDGPRAGRHAQPRSPRRAPAPPATTPARWTPSPARAPAWPTTSWSSPGHAGAYEVRDALRRSIACLSERQRLVLHLRFVEELTQGEIGERIGVSQMQVSRILRAILDRLRADLRDDDPAADGSAA